MATLKLLWKEQQDMRRVQVTSVNETLEKHDGRVITRHDSLRFQDLKNYAFLIFTDLQQLAPLNLLFYYTDNDNEQVRITNDVELEEAFHLMAEIAAMNGTKGSFVVNITLMTKGTTKQQMENDQKPILKQEKKMLDCFIDLAKLIEQWDVGDYQMLQRDLVSLLHEPGCQEALMDVMANEKYAQLMANIVQEYDKCQDFTTCLRAVAGTRDVEEVAKILLLKCPHARSQIERVFQVIQEQRNVQMLSASDVFEPILIEETKQESGPIVAVFEQDVTCPDGTVLTPLQAFDKVWKIKNGGPTKWPIGCKLLCVGGDRMQAPDSVMVPSVLPGSTIDLSLRMQAPSKAGRYTGYWRLSTEDGTRFGQRLWVDINVVHPGSTGSEARGSLGGEVRTAAPMPMVHQHSGSELLIPTAAPAVVAKATSPSKEDQKWSEQLSALAEMGFTNKSQNLQLLELHNGDLPAVISALL